MPGWRIVFAAVLASATLCPLRADALAARILVSRCAAAAGANLQGLVAIRKACPGIDQAVADLGVGTLLSADWDAKASGAALGDLAALAERYAGPPSSALPSGSDLRAIALRLQEPDASMTSVSLWDRVKAWLHRRLAPFAGLLKWWRSLPGGSAGPGLRAVLLVGVGVLILLSVAVIIFMELRSTGVLGPGRRRASAVRRRHAVQKGVVTGGGGADDDVEAARALDRPGSAFRMLIEALRRSRRIERDGNLTCHEVLARAVFDSGRQREGFARVALLAERELFGPGGAPIRVPEELRATLQTLHRELLAVPAAGSAPQ